MPVNEQSILELTGLFFLTWLSEDAAVLGGGFAAATGSLTPWQAFMACFWGIWTGDYLLYAIARYGGRSLASRFLGAGSDWQDRIERSEAWFLKRGIIALAVSRFVPGLRLPTFLAAGFLRMNTLLFLAVTFVMAAVWVSLIFLLVHLFGEAAPKAFHAFQGHIGWIVAIILLLMVLFHLAGALLDLVRKQLGRWEFWPAWLFYIPIALRYLLLAIRYGSLTLPSAANPGIKTGGLIGESKNVMLAELSAIAPESVPPSSLIPVDGDRLAMFHDFLATRGTSFPMVLKPDFGYRGSGFRIVHSSDEAADYLDKVRLPVVVQKYVPGPCEAGIFYYRMPGSAHGTILAITEKHFPKVTGDGKKTIKQLIIADPRAKHQAIILLERFEKRQNEILQHGEELKLVEAGNHAQGCLFSDGMSHWTPELEASIDRISQKVDGFFIGRYDVRFAAWEEFERGTGFQILELNGVAGEPTSAYDASRSIVHAFALLFRHWELAFAIGAENRRRGHHPDSSATILKEWLSYRKTSRCLPRAD